MTKPVYIVVLIKLLKVTEHLILNGFDGLNGLKR